MWGNACQGGKWKERRAWECAFGLKYDKKGGQKSLSGAKSGKIPPPLLYFGKEFAIFVPEFDKKKHISKLIY